MYSLIYNVNKNEDSQLMDKKGKGVSENDIENNQSNVIFQTKDSIADTTEIVKMTAKGITKLTRDRH